MSARPIQSPDSRHPQSTEFPTGSSRPSDRSQTQILPRGILRQPQNHRSSLSRSPPDFGQGHSRRSLTQQQLDSDIHAPRRDSVAPAIPLLVPRGPGIDTVNASVARACGQTPSPPLLYNSESDRSSTSPTNREAEHVPTRRLASRARTHDPRKLFINLDELLCDYDAASNDRFRLHDYLEWADIRALQLRDRDEREDRDRHRSRFAQMRRNPHAEIDPKMGACDDLCYICSQLKTLSCSRHKGSPSRSCLVCFYTNCDRRHHI